MSLPRRSAVLFEDETDLLLFPPLQGAWARRGESSSVGLSGWNARRVLFGAIHVLSGHRLTLVQKRQRAGEFQDFLDVLRWHYRGWHPVLLLDEDSAHTAEETLGVAEDLDIELLSLPKRVPKFNGMDQLWRRAKATVSANKQYESIDEHADRFVRHVLRLSPHDALRKAGILSEDFWLKPYLHGPHG